MFTHSFNHIAASGLYMIPRQNTNIIIFISPADTPLTRRGRGAH